MDMIRQINDSFAIAGPVRFEQLQQIAVQGFRSVLNLRSLSQAQVAEEQQQVERLGLCYVNWPVDLDAISAELAARVLEQIDLLPRPALICCNNATLAAAMVLMQIAISQGQTLQQAFQRAEDLGLFKHYAPIPAQPVSV